MSEFVRHNISLSEFTRRSKPPLQFIKKGEVNINFLILRTIKRACSGFRAAASGLSRIAEKYQLGVSIRRTGLLWQKLRPGILRVIEYERNKLYQRFFRGVASWIRLADRGA